PAGLMTGADPAALVAVEVLIEQEEVPPVRIVLERLGVAVDRPAPVTPAQEEARESPRELGRDLPEIEETAGAGRALDLQVVAVEVVESLQRLDEQVVDRKPDRSAPVRVTAEQPRARFPRLVFFF